MSREGLRTLIICALLGLVIWLAVAAVVWMLV